jgi:hypothetical protein
MRSDELGDKLDCNLVGTRGGEMIIGFDQAHEASFEWLMARLYGFARDLGLREAKTRQIIEQVVVDMPLHTDEERLEWASGWMLAASV